MTAKVIKISLKINCLPATPVEMDISNCIDWVESSPAKKYDNHACVGYEFELRSLHKSHRFDKLITTKNHGNYRMELTGENHKLSRRRGWTKHDLLHKVSKSSNKRLVAGATSLRISKFPFRLMDTGLMQLVHTTFTDSIWSGTQSPSKVFTIKDYSGLFLVFVVLLIISSFLFVCELCYKWLQPILRRILDSSNRGLKCRVTSQMAWNYYSCLVGRRKLYKIYHYDEVHII